MTQKAHPLTTTEGQEWFKSLLRSETVTVEFQKKDGSMRTMICTTKQEVLQEEDAVPKSGLPHISETCPVYDLEDHSWKSFRWDSVREIHVEFQ